MNIPIEASTEASEDETTQQTEKPYKCLQCPYASKRKFDLKRHSNSQHPIDVNNNQNSSNATENVYLCDQCGKTFTTKFGLTLHTKGKHNLQFKHQCSTCHRGFNMFSDFKTHVKQHNKIKDEKCRTCGVSFSDRRALTKHEKTHQLIQGSTCKHHVCSICGQVFKRKDSLEEHTRGTHEGRKQFICSCGKSFSWRSSLKHHKTVCKNLVN